MSVLSSMKCNVIYLFLKRKEESVPINLFFGVGVGFLLLYVGGGGVF